MREAVMLFDEFLELLQKPAQELQLRLLAVHEPGFIADTIGQHATFGYQDKAKLLAQLNPVRRLGRSGAPAASRAGGFEAGV